MATAPSPAQLAGVAEETNVRVAARIRPLLPQEKAANCCSCVTVEPGTRQVVVGTRRAFAFDLVFDVDSTQTEVYDGCVASLLDGCMQGYNATILAYGQTGSGKTHTMGTGQAQLASADVEGITPKVIRNSFALLLQNPEVVHFKASCCYLEIYNEDIRDLLQPSSGHKQGIAIRETPDGVIQVVGLHAEECASDAEMLRCLHDGSVQRTTGATLMNEQSSRSHSIFTVILEQRVQRRVVPCVGAGGCELPTETAEELAALGEGREDDVAATYRTAKFHLVDLAGSERAKRTGAVGSRFKESVSINAGLLALGNVISALGDPAKRGCHVPYRESKLTRLLQDSLGGNSRTLMVACASCADSNFEETTNTLKYAHRARNIKNKPVVNHDPRVAQLAALQDENEALRRELRRFSEQSAAGALSGLRGGLGAQAQGDVASEQVQVLSTKLEAAEGRGAEVAERLAGAEAECDAMRRSLADVYGAVCQHLPAIWQAPGGSSLAGAPPASPAPGAAAASSSKNGRHALSAICEALQAARRLLGDGALAPGGGAPPPAGAETLRLRLMGSTLEELTSSMALDASRSAFDCGKSFDDSHEPGRLRSLSEVRRDSTMLIKKYLDEMSRLETELALYRRKTKQLEDELREAKDDLQKDEDIFEEKMHEMRALADQNEQLRNRLWEASQAGGNWATERALENRGGACSASLISEMQATDEAARIELQDTQVSQQQLERELQTLAQNVAVKEELIQELVHSEREWASTKAQYQQRMQQLQGDLERMQRELSELQGQLVESAQLKEQTRQMEDERRALEKRIAEQMDTIQRKQQEFARLRSLRQQDGLKIRELEAEVKQLKTSHREVDRQLQSERHREAQQISELQRRLQREGQRVRDLEAENLRQKESLKRRVGQPRHSSAAPLSRKGSLGGRAEAPALAACDLVASASATAIGLDRPTPSSSSSSPARAIAPAPSSSLRVQHLEQRLDEYVRRQEAAQALDEDLRKQDALLRKREQYLSYRAKIAERTASKRSEGRARLQQVEARLAALDAEPPPEMEAAAAERVALNDERAELTSAIEERKAEAILQDIDERMEGLQDEIDFREARIAKARQILRSASGLAPGSASVVGALGAELAAATPDDARELLGRCCEKLVRQRQSERQTCKRLAAIEAQSEERARQVAELQSVLKRQDANATKEKAKQAKWYEKHIQTLLQQLGSAQQLPDALGANLVTSVAHLGAECRLSASFEEQPDVARTVDAEVQQLRRDNKVYKDLNRELKRKLRTLLDREGSADGHPHAEPPPASASRLHVEELAAQVDRLENEKAELREEKERVVTQMQNLKQYASRFHNISSVSVRSDVVPRGSPALAPPSPAG